MAERRLQAETYLIVVLISIVTMANREAALSARPQNSSKWQVPAPPQMSQHVYVNPYPSGACVGVLAAYYEPWLLYKVL